MNDSLNPTWNQTFDFVVEDGLHDMLILEVWDHDTFGKVAFLITSCFFAVNNYGIVTLIGTGSYENSMNTVSFPQNTEW